MKGFVSPQTFIPGHIDEDTGLPVEDKVDWGKDYECNYYPNTLSNKGVNVGGKFQQSEYEITIYDMGFDAKVVRLKNSKGKIIAEKEVKSLLELESVQRVKITL